MRMRRMRKVLHHLSFRIKICDAAQSFDSEQGPTRERKLDISDQNLRGIVNIERYKPFLKSRKIHESMGQS